MNFVKLFIIAQIGVTSYVGFTQIEFDLMSEPMRAKLYNSKNTEDIHTIKKISGENKEVIEIENNALAIAYVDPANIGYVKKGEKAEILLENSPANSIEYVGKIVAIEQSAIEPNDNIDYFHYRVLFEIDPQIAKEYMERESQFSLMARVQIADNITASAWLDKKFDSLFSLSFLM